MREFQFDVRLTLRAPVLSQASGARAYGVDTAGLRDSSNLPALPGSLIRGNLRHAWKALRENFPGRNEIPSEDETKAWFGAESETGTDDEPCRGWARFAEYWTVDKRTVEQRKDKGVRHRIERNQEKGAVESGSLQVIESPFSTGESVVYSGWIRAWCRDAAEADRLAQWIRKGLEYVPALGALKGAGFGRVLKVEVSHQPVPSSPGAASSVDPKVTAFGIVLTLDRPFCFARSHPPDSNRYESEDFIPGGASKGAIARRLRQSARDTGPLDHPAFPLLCQYFDVLRFTHAFPAMAANTVRPVMPPLSLMIGPKDATPDPPDNLYDVALRDGPGLIHNRAPAFSMDWKDKHFGMAYEKCGWGKPPERCLIIRTEINPKTGTAFKNKLFATECVTPDGHRWLANVDLSKVAENDRKQIIEELEKLLAAGLDRLGKTEAETKKIEILPGCPAPALHSYPLIHNGLAVVTLQSAARLSCPTRGGSCRPMTRSVCLKHIKMPGRSFPATAKPITAWNWCASLPGSNWWAAITSGGASSTTKLPTIRRYSPCPAACLYCGPSTNRQRKRNSRGGCKAACPSSPPRREAKTGAGRLIWPPMVTVRSPSISSCTGI